MTTHVDAPPVVGPNKEPETTPQKKHWVVALIGILLVAIAIVVGVARYVHRRHATSGERDKREQELAKGPHVQTIVAAMSSSEKEITLPGDVRGFEQATLYAKISGYLRVINVERGQWVKKGQVIAIVESPESDQDVRSAIADAIAKRVAAQRYAALTESGVASALDRDNAEAAARVAEANVAKTKSVSGYEIVKAPFDGVVTARYVDPGALIPAATSIAQSAQPIVDVALVDRLRIFVYLGQDSATFVKEGDAVDVWQDEKPTQISAGEVTRIANALDPRTRTMQCEIDLDNKSRDFLPGVFVRVRLRLKVPPSPVVPNEALVIRDGATHVAVIEDGKVRLAKVELGVTDGKSVRIVRGLNGGEHVAINVPVSLDDGDKVQPKEMPPPKPFADPDAPKKNDAATKPEGDKKNEGTQKAKPSKQGDAH